MCADCVMDVSITDDISSLCSYGICYNESSEQNYFKTPVGGVGGVKARCINCHLIIILLKLKRDKTNINFKLAPEEVDGACRNTPRVEIKPKVSQLSNILTLLDVHLIQFSILMLANYQHSYNLLTFRVKIMLSKPIKTQFAKQKWLSFLDC